MPSPTTGLFPSAQRRRAVVLCVGTTAAALIAIAGAALSACTSSPSAAPSNRASIPPAVGTLAPSERPPTTPVPAPTAGTIRQQIGKASVHVYSPVPLSRGAHFARGIAVRVLSASRFRAEAHMPGEISGPAVRVTIRITNESGRTVSLGGLAVNCVDALGTPLVEMQSAPVHRFSGSLTSGDAMQAIYVFELAKIAHAARGPLTITLDNAATHSSVQFYGRAS